MQMPIGMALFSNERHDLVNCVAQIRHEVNSLEDTVMRNGWCRVTFRSICMVKETGKPSTIKRRYTLRGKGIERKLGTFGYGPART